jgi:hypothetical protein
MPVYEKLGMMTGEIIVTSELSKKPVFGSMPVQGISLLLIEAT